MQDKTVYLNEVARECMAELDALDIHYGNIQAFTINTRSLRRWGQCRYRNGSYTINISCRLLEESVPREILKQTVLHEILHTCKNCMNHKTEWKAVANQVNRAYGYNIKRCTSAEELGLQEVQVKKSYKHLFQCACCGNEIPRFRESNFTRNYTHYRCALCNGTIKKIY